MKKIDTLHNIYNRIASNRDIEIFGMFGPGNLGDEAMLVAAKEYLPKNRCYGYKNLSHLHYLNKIISKKAKEHLFIAGGTLIHGGKSGWLDYIEMRAVQGSKLHFYGTGVAFTDDQINNESENFLRWKKILQSAESINLRGPLSVSTCKRMNVSANVFGDFAFLLCDEKYTDLSRLLSNKTFGLNFGNCLGDQDSFDEKAAILVKELSKEHNIIFYNVVDSDIEHTNRIIKISGIDHEKYSIENHFYCPKKFISSVRKNCGFIGLKLHGAGLAMIAGVPSIMMAYKDKCYDFMAPILENSPTILPLNSTIDLMLEKLTSLKKSPENFIHYNEIVRLKNHQVKTLKDIDFS